METKLNLFITIFCFTTPVFCQKDESNINGLEYKTLTMNQFCDLLNDSLSFYKSKNFFIKKLTKEELYMVALIANTIEIYSDKNISKVCNISEEFYTYDEWLNNILMLHDEVIGYRGLIFYTNKEKYCQKLIFIKLKE